MKFAGAPTLRPFILFGLSIALGRGMSIVSIPLIANHLSPTDYGRLELIASMVEIVAIFANFALADTLFRFASGQDKAGAAAAAKNFTGCALIIAVSAAAVTQCFLLIGAAHLNLVDMYPALAFGLLAACLSGLVELPLAWLRFQERPGRFLMFVAFRSLLQIGMMSATLSLGYGVTGILAGNAFVDIVLAVTLLVLQIRETGIGLNRQALARICAYGLPLVGGAVSMFVLGACDRWFLAAAVASSELAYYALAGKLALIVALLMSPFGLWWYPRRLSLLTTAEGLERSSRMVGVGIVLIGAGALTVCGAIPVFVSLLLPEAYSAALYWLPWLVLIACMNEICSLLNAGAYARSHGAHVLLANASGAACALAGYAMFVLPFGVAGAIGATVFGQGVRLVIFLVSGRKLAPIRYRWDIAAVALLVNLVTVLGTAVYPATSVRLALFAAAFGILAMMAWRLTASPTCHIRESLA